MDARQVAIAGVAMQVVSFVVLLLETVFLLLYVPSMPLTLLLLPFIAPFGASGLMGDVLMLLPLIVYGLVALWWMVMRAGRVRTTDIPRGVRIGLYCGALAGGLLVLGWVGELVRKEFAVSEFSNMVGGFALLTLLVIRMQLWIAGWRHGSRQGHDEA